MDEPEVAVGLPAVARPSVAGRASGDNSSITHGSGLVSTDASFAEHIQSEGLGTAV